MSKYSWNLYRLYKKSVKQLYRKERTDLPRPKVKQVTVFTKNYE